MGLATRTAAADADSSHRSSTPRTSLARPHAPDVRRPAPTSTTSPRILRRDLAPSVPARTDRGRSPDPRRLAAAARLDSTRSTRPATATACPRLGSRARFDAEREPGNRPSNCCETVRASPRWGRDDRARLEADLRRRPDIASDDDDLDAQADLSNEWPTLPDER